MKIYLSHDKLSQKVCSKLFPKMRRFFRRYFRKPQEEDDPHLQGFQFYDYVEFFDGDANGKVYDLLQSGAPCMISKFGTTELDHLVQHRLFMMKTYDCETMKDYFLYEIHNLNWQSNVRYLVSHSGFFPDDPSYLPAFYDEYLKAIKQIDILGSYIRNEKYFAAELENAVRINLDGYYAPFYYKDPWTRYLKGKKVLVVHPFAEDIRSQYEKREQIWADHDVLPEFGQLITYKAVQSILGTKTEFATWFDALEKMKADINQIDFDVALIGCGAYGMPLAAHCKSLGKQAIHLAGWLQVLFGIRGTRWDNNPRVAEFINDSWIRPSENTRPKNANLVENACYW